MRRLPLDGPGDDYALAKQANANPSRERPQYVSDYAVALEDDAGVVGLFPIHTKNETAISAAYFSKVASELHPDVREVAATRIARTLRDVGMRVPADISKYENAYVTGPVVDAPAQILLVTETEKVASAADFALPHKQKYPLRHAADVTAAVRYIESNFASFDRADIPVYVEKVAAAATRFQVQIPDYFVKFAYADEPERVVQVGTHTVREAQLTRLAERQSERIGEIISPQFAEEFKKSPFEQFSALPLPNQQLLLDLETT